MTILSRMGGCVAGLATGWFTGMFGFAGKNINKNRDAEDNVPPEIVVGNLFMLPWYAIAGIGYAAYRGALYGFEAGLEGALHEEPSAMLKAMQAREEAVSQLPKTLAEMFARGVDLSNRAIDERLNFQGAVAVYKKKVTPPQPLIAVTQSCATPPSEGFLARFSSIFTRSSNVSSTKMPAAQVSNAPTKFI